MKTSPHETQKTPEKARKVSKAISNLATATNLILNAAKSKTNADLSRDQTLLLSVFCVKPEVPRTHSELEASFRKILASNHNEIVGKRFERALRMLQKKGLLAPVGSSERVALTKKGTAELDRVADNVDEAFGYVMQSLAKKKRAILREFVVGLDLESR